MATFTVLRMYRLNLVGITAKPPKWQITVELRKWCVGLYCLMRAYQSCKIVVKATE